MVLVDGREKCGRKGMFGSIDAGHCLLRASKDLTTTSTTVDGDAQSISFLPSIRTEYTHTYHLPLLWLHRDVTRQALPQVHEGRSSDAVFCYRVTPRSP